MENLEERETNSRGHKACTASRERPRAAPWASTTANEQAIHTHLSSMANKRYWTLAFLENMAYRKQRKH
eukprot:1932191-Amphidinium_carterae.1